MGCGQKCFKRRVFQKVLYIMRWTSRRVIIKCSMSVSKFQFKDQIHCNWYVWSNPVLKKTNSLLPPKLRQKSSAYFVVQMYSCTACIHRRTEINRFLGLLIDGFFIQVRFMYELDSINKHLIRASMVWQL